MKKEAYHPIESPRLITLDQLRPFDLNPRIIRNPFYDEIKESIRYRGLDNPPQITQRPDEEFFIIANGGNTRLAILNELWQETRNESYFNIYCLFRSWPESDNVLRGNLRCLIGHLAESDLHGRLTFIERALGIARAKNLYEQEQKTELSQNMLARKLRDDGYPAIQQHIGKMLQSIEFLLPHIPETLYGGLGRPQIEKLLSLRTNAENLWNIYSEGRQLGENFDDIFSMSLTPFNGPIEGFSHSHVQDELLGMMSQALGVDYNLLALNTDASEQKRQTLFGPPTEPIVAIANVPEHISTAEVDLESRIELSTASDDLALDINESDELREEQQWQEPEESPNDNPQALLANNNSSQRVVSTHPQASDEPINPSDTLWDIDPLFDYPESLMSMSDRLAWEIATSCGIENLITPTSADSSLPGFELSELSKDASNEAKSCWQVLSFLSSTDNPSTHVLWRALLLGDSTTAPGWPDEFVINLFRLIRIIRRLREKQLMEVQL